MYVIAYNPQSAEAVVGITARLAQSQYFISPVQGLVLSEDPGIIFAVASALNGHGLPYAASPLPPGPWRKYMLYRLTEGYKAVHACWMCGRVSETEAFCKYCTSVSLIATPFAPIIRVPLTGFLEIWWMTRFRSGEFFPGAEVELTTERTASTLPEFEPHIVLAADAIAGAGIPYNVALRIMDGYYAFGRPEWKTPRATHNLMLLHDRFPSYNAPPECSVLRAIANYPNLFNEIGEYEWSTIMERHKELLAKESRLSRSE